MSGPGVVCIKRKRSLPAPERLIVEPSSKRSKSHVHYVLQRGDDAKSSTADHVKDSHQRDGGTLAVKSERPNSEATANHPSEDGLPVHPTLPTERRIFHLKRPSTPRKVLKKRKGDHAIATFVEEKRARTRGPDPTRRQIDEDARSGSSPSLERFKRPSKRAAVSDRFTPSHATPEHNLEGIAESLHQFALEEAAKEKPRISRFPKLSGQRSRELHRQRVSSAAATSGVEDQDVDMDQDEDADYVYDTYVLAPTINAGAAQVEAQGSSGNVGYLVITEEDQQIWEEYIEDEPSDKDWDSDEDDENAEDWYGADYPEEELAMDDEFDENPYKYRNNDMSDDEEWGSDNHSWSDDEYERQMQPWRSKTAKRYRKYLDDGGEKTEADASETDVER